MRASIAAVAVLLIQTIAGEPVSGAPEAEGARRVVPRREFEKSQVIEPEKLAKADHGDGTWSYALPDGFDPEIRVRGRILTWRYAGQAKYERDPKPVTGPRVWVATEETALPPAEQVRRVQRIDRWGRIWRVAEIDRAAWKKAIEVEDRDSPEVTEDEPRRRERDDEPSPPPGTEVKWWPQSWTHSNCDSAPDPVNETHLWDGESRGAINSGHTPRQATAVKVLAAGTCSGVILKARQVLTGAHCVSTDSNNPVANSSVTVCRDDIPNACLGVVDIDFPDSYGGGSRTGGGTDFADDWAILELASTWVAAGFADKEDMDLSKAEDSTLDALTKVHNLGFPGFARNCDNANGNTLFHNRELEPIAATKKKKLKLRIDTTAGHSGGPYYYCPTADNDVCGPGEKGYVYGVHAGWNSFDDRAVGPKVPYFRDAALAFIND